jgi:hypothetical protein
VPGNFDELRKQIEQDELEDQLEVALEGNNGEHGSKMTVIDFARARKMQPQLVYYYLKTHKLEQEKCICGRWVLDVKEATEFFDSLDHKKVERRSGVKR